MIFVMFFNTFDSSNRNLCFLVTSAVKGINLYQLSRLDLRFIYFLNLGGK